MNLHDIPTRTNLFFTQGGSDKSYQVEVVQNGDLFDVMVSYGRRGSTQKVEKKTSSPVTLAMALNLMAKVVGEKKRKGYTEDVSGSSYSGSEQQGNISGVLPQLLNPVTRDELTALIDDDAFVASEKFDGERRLLMVRDGLVQGINRKGFFVPIPTAWASLASACKDAIVDGEAIGDLFYAFDLLDDGSDMRSAPFTRRYRRLAEIAAAGNCPWLRVVPVASDPSSKAELATTVEARKGEGVVLRRATAPYSVGKPNSGGDVLKFKFLESASVLVASIHPTKRSVSVQAADAFGAMVALGNVTIPPNYPMPAIGALVEVQYLYWFGLGGSLFQPIYRGERSDLDTSAATIAQITRIKPQASVDDDE